MKYKVLELLKNSKDFLSGEKISEEFGVSRSYIWKCIKNLREEGYNIESISNRGYRLIESPDKLTYIEIEKYLDTKFIGREIEYFESIDSTNTYGKEIARESNEGRIIIAEEQTKGRGRLGRDWQSNKNEGIYFSIILKPKLSPEKISRLTLVGASAVVMALDELGIESYIKWPNDVIVNNKKLCGILTEMAGELNSIDYVIMGIGINANNSMESFDEEVLKKATSLKLELGEKINRQSLLASILNNFEKLYLEFTEEDKFESTLKIARERSILIGREVRLIRGNEKENIRVIDINENGELLVEGEDGKERLVYSGEVSIRGKDGYI